MELGVAWMVLMNGAGVHAGGAADGEKGKKDPEYKAKADAPKSAWTKPNAQVRICPC